MNERKSRGRAASLLQWKRWKRGLGSLLLFALLCVSPNRCSAYSVLTHEAIIDLSWNDSIRPLLLSRYPGTTEDQLTIAHAYAYGGCAIQDAGYYPFGNQFFSDLTHYVRSGDFVLSLLRHAQNVDEYAFAIGALSHYVGDSVGHAEAINPATAIEYPKLARKYGPIVTYQDDRHAYVATEFSFDVDQISHRRFAPDDYLHFIGLKVPRQLLERAFFETYGLSLTSVLGKTTPEAIRSYRGSIRSFIPAFAKSEVVIHRHDFPQDDENQAFEEIEERLAHAAYRPRWSGAYRAPGFGEHALAIVIRILPPIGPISYLKIRGPNSTTEQMYVRSLNHTLDIYDSRLDHLRLLAEIPLQLPNRDLDTGDWTKPGAYALTDETYAALLHAITSKPEQLVPSGLQRDILNYYSNPGSPITTKKDGTEWARVQRELLQLRQMKLAGPEDIFRMAGAYSPLPD